MSNRFDHLELKLDDLWNEDTDMMSNDRYYTLLIEQYRIYVDLSDRASARRIFINLFFLVANIMIVGMMVIGITNSGGQDKSLILLSIPFFGLLALCYSWWRVVRFYRHTLHIKDKVIGALEQRLPSSPIFSAESAVAEKSGSFKPIKHMETNMPFVFMLLYTFIYMYLWIIWQH